MLIIVAGRSALADPQAGLRTMNGIPTIAYMSVRYRITTQVGVPYFRR